MWGINASWLTLLGHQLSYGLVASRLCFKVHDLAHPCQRSKDESRQHYLGEACDSHWQVVQQTPTAKRVKGKEQDGGVSKRYGREF